ncbi:MAG: TIGR02452 family protein [Massilia sp.]
MNNREFRSGIAKDTLAILAAGSYRNAAGVDISIARELDYAKGASVHYTGAALAHLTRSGASSTRHVTQFEVHNESTFSAARRLVGAGHRDPLCLNFASAKNPGGGFLGGAEAQEENLAKSSGLYPCIVQMSPMYEANRALGSCMYLDDMIYSPQVPVFRDDGYALLDTPYIASIVTAPAVNRGALARNEPERVCEVDAVMAGRIDKLLALAVHHGHTTLVLGAWGCGVFGNRPVDMARWFGDHLLRNPRYRDAFALVSFAVLDRKNDGTFAAFEAEFGEGR